MTHGTISSLWSRPRPTRGNNPYDVVGPICESGDTFAKQRLLPEIAQNDLVVFRSAGAYGAVMASEYNTRPPAPEVIVSGDRFAIARPRLTYDDILGKDRIPDWLDDPETEDRRDHRPNWVGERHDSDPTATKLPKALVAKARAARRSLWIERLLRAFWPLWIIAALAGTVWFLGVFDSAPGDWPLYIAAVFAACGLTALVAGAMRLRSPTRGEVLRSLDEGLANRAASMLDEDIAVGGADTDAVRMWQAHRERLMRDVEGARAPAPNTRLSAFDTWGLRFIALFALVIAFAYSRVGGADRVAAILSPAPVVAEAAVLEPALEAWVAPPPYTGVAPIYMTEKSGQALAVPTGSIVTLRASGMLQAPTVTGTTEPFGEDASGGVYGLTLAITEDTDLKIVHEDATLGDWSLAVIPDMPPEIGVSEEPAPTATRALGFSFTAEDDYGVTAARATIVADRSEMTDPPDAIEKPIELTLSPPLSVADEVIEQKVEQEFIEHPWAGSPVVMTLYAEDAAGHVTESAPVKFILPGKVFTEPMAKALIEQRRDLAWDYRNAWDALDLIEAFTDYPDDYFTDPTAFLATSTAKKRLTYAVEEDRFLDEREDILDLLWKAASRLEEGDLDNALEQLRSAQRRLKDALERGASDEELEQLMAELREKMNEYLDEMARQAMRDQQNGQEQQQGQQQNQQSMTREDLEKLLDQLEQTAKDGSRDQAEQMLSALSQMLENLQMSQGQGQGQGSQQEQALQDMMRRQQELADETFQDLQEGQNGSQQQRPGQQGQNGQQGQQGQQGQGQQGQNGQGQGQGQGGRQGQQGQGNREPGNGQSQGQGNQLGQGRGGQGREGGQSDRGGGGTLQGRQEGLRGELDGMLGGLPGDNARDALGDAEREMGAARDSLGEGDLNGAIDGQARALDRLREGAQALAEEAAKNAQEGEGSPNGRQQGADRGQSAEQFDPFGRLSRTVGPDDGLGVEVPGERARNRALEIQREIRRRQSERDRPEVEREYLDRLQKRF